MELTKVQQDDKNDGFGAIRQKSHPNDRFTLSFSPKKLGLNTVNFKLSMWILDK